MEKEKFKWSPVLALGSVWGLGEAAMGIYLRGSCARFITGSVMTGFAIFFIAAIYSCYRRFLPLFLLLLITVAFKLLDARLLGLPVLHGAVGNPIFAFYTEVFAFILIVKILDSHLNKTAYGHALMGGMAALVAVNLFPLVKFATGIPACVVPGTTYPLALYYAPLAVGLSALSCPLGMVAGNAFSKEFSLETGKKKYPGFVPALVRFIPLSALFLMILLRVG